MHNLAVYVKEGLSFARDLSPQNFADSYLCFLTGFTSLSVLLLFLDQATSSSLCMAWVFMLLHLT